MRNLEIVRYMQNIQIYLQGILTKGVEIMRRKTLKHTDTRVMWLCFIKPSSL
jgi:hypothetical protein